MRLQFLITDKNAKNRKAVVILLGVERIAPWISYVTEFPCMFIYGIS